MDELQYDNFTPGADKTHEKTAGVRQTQTKLSESIRRGENDFDSMLDGLFAALGEYDSIGGNPTADTDDILFFAEEDDPSAPSAPESISPESLSEQAVEDFDGFDESPAEDQPVIFGVDEQPDEHKELEASFLRRVARREHRHSESDTPSGPPAVSSDEDGSDAAAFSADEFSEYLHQSSENAGLIERLMRPVVRYMATRKARQKLREQEAASWPAPLDIRDTHELSAKKASRYYSSQLRSMGLRLCISLFFTLVLIWLGVGFPAAGQLANPRMQAAVSLVFLLSSMVCALDVVSVGIRQIFHLQPAMEALCTAACLFSCLDALFMILGKSDLSPYCAVAALSLTTALWAQRLKCKSYDISFRTISDTPSNSILTAEKDSEGLTALIRSDRAHDGIVRRSEEADGSQNAYAVAAPLFLILSLALAGISTIGKDWMLLFHHFAAYLAVCSNAAGFLCFSLPWFITTLSLRRSGAAIAGWPGCADIGRVHRIIVTDSDMFPSGTIKLAGANILEGIDAKKAVCYTVSLLTASGSSVTEAFQELMQYRKYTLSPVEDFKCHDGGGLSAYIHSENVLVGSSGFLNLMGIRIPRDIQTENAVCIAISNELVGVFNLRYVPIKGVRYALDRLLQGYVQPVFAIRDFNITPLMIQELFRIPAINFEFPSFRERYRLSTLFGNSETKPAAVLAHPSIRCAVETAEQGRKLYVATIVNTTLSLLSSAVGILLVFLSCRSGNYAAISTGRLLLYVILWALPQFGVGYWMAR